MTRQIFRDICLPTLLVGCSIVAFLVPLTMQNPLKPKSVGPVPWASPCTPNGYTNSGNQESSDDIRGYLIEKSQDSYYHTEYIQDLLISKLGDPGIVDFLRNKDLEGFPKPAVKEIKQMINATNVLIEHYDQLSRAAVFLEYIYKEDIDNDVKIELEDLFFNLLSHMCEIQLAFVKSGQPKQFPVTDRSILPELDSNTYYRRYKSSMIIILKYQDLLHFYITQYNKRMYF